MIYRFTEVLNDLVNYFLLGDILLLEDWKQANHLSDDLAMEFTTNESGDRIFAEGIVIPMTGIENYPYTILFNLSGDRPELCKERNRLQLRKSGYSLKVDHNTKQDILAFYEKELERVKPTTVKHYHALIHGALNYAVDKNLIPSNPADRIIISKPEPFKGDYYLDSEVLNLFEVIKGHKIELVVLLTAFYGLRRSEVIGLKWSAFDFNHNCFSIRHTVTTCNVKGERVTIKKDKAKNKSSLRTYPLIPFLKERLLEAKKQQEENRKLCGRAYNKEYLGYVCVDVIGNLIKPNYVSSTFGKLLAKNNLRHIRFHDLRHTCASLLLANGVPMEQVKEWLGHSEISTTVDIYGHLQYATKKQSAAAIEQDIVAPMLQNLSAVSP